MALSKRGQPVRIQSQRHPGGKPPRPPKKALLWGNILVTFLLAAGGCSGSPAPPTGETPPLVELQAESQLLEETAVFYSCMPAGIAVSRKGRLFVSFPRWGDPVDTTIAEIHN